MLTVSVTADKFQFTPSLLHLGCLQTFKLNGFAATVARTISFAMRNGMNFYSDIILSRCKLWARDWRVMAFLCSFVCHVFSFFKLSIKETNIFCFSDCLRTFIFEWSPVSIIIYFNKSPKCCNFWAQKLSEIDCFWCNLWPIFFNSNLYYDRFIRKQVINTKEYSTSKN